ncbi:MAG: UbiD family decarboxylase [Saprospiraceae bacterium]
MSYQNLQSALNSLHKNNELLVIKDLVDPNLEMAEIQRRIYQKKGPALLFENVLGTPFRACSNLYGTTDRCEFLFKDAIAGIEHLIRLKINPQLVFKEFAKTLKHLPFMLSANPRKSYFKKPILQNQCLISDLPQVISWPDDGGAFITLPQVISFPPGSNKLSEANIGMYRIQISGNEYMQNKEIGLHYQLHRGIGIHHTAYNSSEYDFKISIGIGGPPAYALGSIFPLPEGLSEILFSGLLNNRAYRYFWKDNYFIPTDADFCIVGSVVKNQLKPEGPFGDHLGYYSLKHDFPFVKVDKVFHKDNPIWHFTVVGRPPQEDSGFGFLIHQMVKEISKNEFPGVKEIHAVDVAGVHPLLLAIGSERYMPFRNQKPEEILTQANHILGKGQTSLAKYLFITTNLDDNNLNIQDIEQFLSYILERVDWTQDLHFQTNTTIDTLDYSGNDWNAGSKLIVACNRPKCRNLGSDLTVFASVKTSISKIKLFRKGIVLIQTNKFTNYETESQLIQELCDSLISAELDSLPLLVIVDDLDFCAAELNNFLWVSFTRSNPSYDVYGIQSFTEHKHWGCRSSLIIDARIKPHHAPVLETNSVISKKVDQLFQSNKELKKYSE